MRRRGARGGNSQFLRTSRDHVPAPVRRRPTGIRSTASKQRSAALAQALVRIVLPGPVMMATTFATVRKVSSPYFHQPKSRMVRRELALGQVRERARPNTRNRQSSLKVSTAHRRQVVRVPRPDLGYRQNGAYSIKNGETTRRSEGGGVSIARPEHRLTSIKLGLKIQDENAVNSIARKRPTKTLLSLFAIESHFGKLVFVLAVWKPSWTLFGPYAPDRAGPPWTGPR